MDNSFLAPRKALGQNFLQDANIIRKIVESVNCQADQLVLEIGPGRGALTDLLLEQASHLHVIEFDRDLGVYWQGRAEKTANLSVSVGDVLKYDFADMAIVLKESGVTKPKFKVIGNLPYNISSPILFRLMEHVEQIDSIIVMLQKEVVQRMVASPGNKQYGRLSVMLQNKFAIESLFNVPPGAFFPPPKIDSAIVRLQPLERAVCPIENEVDFAKIVKQSFAQRRKTLRNTLKETLTAEQIAETGIDPICRAETLSVDDFVKLTNYYSQHKDL